MNGTAVYVENQRVDILTHGDGLPLEVYYSYRFVPVTTKNAKVIGMYNQATDTTSQILAERRLTTVRDMSDQMLVARTTKEYYNGIVEVLEQNPHDAPFALCYSVHPRQAEGPEVIVDVKLQTTIGVPLSHPEAQSLTLTLPMKMRYNFGPNAERLSSPTLSALSALSSGSGRMYHSSDSRSWPILKALTTHQCVLIDDCRPLIEGYELRVWDQLPVSAIVVPVCSESSMEIPESVLILGLNVLRPLDADYDAWIQVIRANLAASLRSVQAYEAEQKRIDDGAAMERAKTAWFRGAAHDLRSPLTLICGPLEDLLESNLNPRQKSTVVTAKRNAERLMRLVNALMDFSRLEAGRVEGRFVPTDLGSFVSNLAALFRPAVERMRIRFSIQIQPHDKLVYIDPILFETAISNLIGNALKYTEEGAIIVRVSYGEVAEIAVIDTGVGIPSNEIGMVTEWYHRATTTVHTGTQGTGLGLALAKELIKIHDGDLLITSQTAAESGGPHGSTFTARIPLSNKIAAAHGTAGTFGAYGRELAKEAMYWATDTETDTSSDGGGDSSGSSARLSEGLMFEKTDLLLLVDDNLDMRKYIRHIFTPFCTVIEAANGEEALQMARTTPPNLILSDVMMPKMNGFDLLSAIRKSPETTIVPMVLLSAMKSDEARVDALIMGAEDFMEKPFKPKELLARVHLHMQVGKKRANLEKLFVSREAEIALLSDYCPSGIMRADKNGHLIYGNEAWRKMAGMSANDDPDSWGSFVDQATHMRIGKVWMDFVYGEEKELKLSWKWRHGSAVSGFFIRLDLALSSLSGILGCVTDTTYEEQRLVEAEERRLEAEQRRLEAEESKHQQELLIDLTSHEIRTPVSAILQCSSLVKENLVALKDQLKWSGSNGFWPTAELLEDLEEDVEALESEFEKLVWLMSGIYQCGLVQERIAGDILSLARIQLGGCGLGDELMSDMLSMHAIDLDLRREARKILTVFASEAKMKKIELALDFGDTLHRAKVNEIKTDPVRLGQVSWRRPPELTLGCHKSYRKRYANSPLRS